MSALKWNRWCLGAADCKVGLFCVTAYARATPRLVVSVLRDHGRECSSLDEAIDFAEAKLRDMLTDLQQHFAPVLRWVDNGDGESIAQNVSGWTLGASHGNWYLSHPTADALIRSPRPNRASVDDNRRAAEAALRSLGVVFRVEGE